MRFEQLELLLFNFSLCLIKFFQKVLQGYKIYSSFLHFLLKIEDI